MRCYAHRVYFRAMKGKDIKRIREKLDLSQSEFAELVGVNLRTLQNWEIDRNGPTAAAVALLKAADAGLLTRRTRKRKILNDRHR
ncbi:MAG: hypothetical protein A3G24_28450 [Betaproteobacteria bacterium RIFCSPLOWO2_12_FULL_62_13]|nr:MAG: hypothetical protein A3G24_28450 [Betaproteobacteria bacterium RIFCSPLOWO2_12_FULL_62_13]